MLECWVSSGSNETKKIEPVMIGKLETPSLGSIGVETSLNKKIGLNLWSPEDSLLNYKVKRISDFFISLILIVFTSPILLLTSIAIKLTSEGPIIFKQSRYGLNGKSFIMFKFRTMYFQEKNSKKIIQAKLNDKRITKVGRFIRKYCIQVRV